MSITRDPNFYPLNAIIMFVCGVFFLLAGLLATINEYQLEQRGQIEQAKVIRVYSNDRGHDSIEYELVVKGTRFRGDTNITKAAREQAESKGAVDVLYLPDNPQNNRLTETNYPPYFIPAFMILLGGSSCVVSTKLKRFLMPMQERFKSRNSYEFSAPRNTLNTRDSS
jgi:hypothetical protein